jgi:hypothetical protein
LSDFRQNWIVSTNFSKTTCKKFTENPFCSPCGHIILPLVLYGCETWSLTLREEHRLRVFENRMLRWIFGPKWDEVTGEWRKLHNEELHDLYSSPSIIRIIKSRMMRWAGHVAPMGRRGTREKARAEETTTKTKSRRMRWARHVAPMGRRGTRMGYW